VVNPHDGGIWIPSDMISQCGVVVETTEVTHLNSTSRNAVRGRGAAAAAAAVAAAAAAAEA